MRLLPALACLLAIASAHAADGVRVCLNWTPGADHAMFYLARAEGWFAGADLAVELRPGAGSPDAVAKLAGDECEVAVADFGAVLAARARGADVVAVMALMADSPLAIYAVAPIRLDSPADLAGRRVAAEPKELARRLWPAVARRAGVDPDSPLWVDRPNNAKVDALEKGDAEFAFNTFYHHHPEFVAAFGERLQVRWWRDLGVNPYGNVLVARGADLDAGWLARLVPIVQRGVAACVRDDEGCVGALVSANGFLDRDRERAKWRAMRPLVAPPRLRGTPLGAFEPERLAAGLAEPPPSAPGRRPGDAITNRLLDPGRLVP